VLESYVTKRRDRKATLKFLKKTMKRYGPPEIVVTDKLRSYGAAMKIIGNVDRQETGRWLNNRAENSHLFSDDENRRCCASDERRHCRNSSPSTLRSTIISTRNVTFIHVLISSSTATLLSPSGVNSLRHKRNLHVLAETGSHSSDSTAK